jgi:hypothetical protein
MKKKISRRTLIAGAVSSVVTLFIGKANAASPDIVLWGYPKRGENPYQLFYRLNGNSDSHPLRGGMRWYIFVNGQMIDPTRGRRRPYVFTAYQERFPVVFVRIY